MLLAFNTKYTSEPGCKPREVVASGVMLANTGFPASAVTITISPTRFSADTLALSTLRALKPGGVLGVIEHRGNPAVPQDPNAASGYVNQDYAIAMVEQAGFVLEATSEINANSNDTKDYETGVWTLPPTLRLQEKDKDMYQAIGESDRFTLRFVKPSA